MRDSVTTTNNVRPVASNHMSRHAGGVVKEKELRALPALACTTSVPPSCVRVVRASISAWLRSALCVACSCTVVTQATSTADGQGPRTKTDSSGGMRLLWCDGFSVYLESSMNDTGVAHPTAPLDEVIGEREVAASLAARMDVAPGGCCVHQRRFARVEGCRMVYILPILPAVHMRSSIVLQHSAEIRATQNPDTFPHVLSSLARRACC